MPQLLTFLACRSVLVDEQSKGMSIINILDIIRAVKDESMQPDLVAPIDWDVFTWWLGMPEDQGKVLQQKISLINPIGEEVFSVIGEFSFTLPKHRVIARSPVFPVFYAGAYNLHLSLHEQEGWTDIAVYTITVEHTEPDVTPGSINPSSEE